MVGEIFDYLDVDARREKANFLRFFSKDDALGELDYILFKRPRDSLSYFLKAKIYSQEEHMREYISNFYHMLFSFSEDKNEREKAVKVMNQNVDDIFLYFFLPSFKNALCSRLKKKPSFIMKRTLAVVARGYWKKEKDRPRKVFREEFCPLVEKQFPEATLDFLEALVTENEYYDSDSMYEKDLARKEAKELYTKAFEKLTQTDNFSFQDELESSNQVFLGKVPLLPSVLFVGKTNEEPHELKKEYDLLRRIHDSIDIIETSLVPFPFYFGRINDKYFLFERFFEGKLLSEEIRNFYVPPLVLTKALKNLISLDEAFSSNYYLFGSSTIPIYDYYSELSKRIERAPSLAPKKDLILECCSPFLEELKNADNQICHGDPHSRNFIVSYKDVKVLDFEKLTWAHPFFDISYFLEQPDISKRIEDRVAFGKDALADKHYDFKNYPLAASFVDILQTVRCSSWYANQPKEYFLQLGKYFQDRALTNIDAIKGNFSPEKRKKLEGLVKIIEEESKYIKK